jgi:hypothetical protein
MIATRPAVSIASTVPASDIAGADPRSTVRAFGSGPLPRPERSADAWITEWDYFWTTIVPLSNGTLSSW